MKFGDEDDSKNSLFSSLTNDYCDKMCDEGEFIHQNEEKYNDRIDNSFCLKVQYQGKKELFSPCMFFCFFYFLKVIVKKNKEILVKIYL